MRLLLAWQIVGRDSVAGSAAPTTGLPEQEGGERNWDYRYTWIRDGSFFQLRAARPGYVEAAYVLWPFGRTIDRRPSAGLGSLLGNVLWVGLASFKIIPITLLPLGVRIVPEDHGYTEAA